MPPIHPAQQNEINKFIFKEIKRVRERERLRERETEICSFTLIAMTKNSNTSIPLLVNTIGSKKHLLVQKSSIVKVAKALLD